MILHQNVRSFQANSDEFLSFISKINRNIEIMIFSETWFSDQHVGMIEGYKEFHAFRTERVGGGVSVFIREDSKVKCILKEAKVLNSIEYCIVEIYFTPGFTLKLLAMYRPPDASIIETCDELNSILENSLNGNMNFICGDLNIDLLNPDAADSSFIELLTSFLYSPLINLPTRETNFSSKCIDHFWTNSLGEFETGVIPHDITDHYCTFVECPIVYERDLLTVKFHDCSDERITILKEKLREFCSEFLSYQNIDINTKTEIFCNKFTRLYAGCCPVVTKKISYKRFCKPWLTPDLLELINKKHSLFKQYKRGIVDFNTYNNTNLRVSYSLKKAKKEYFRNKFSMYKSNTVKSWKLINSLLNKNKKRKDIVLERGERRLCESGEVAEALNDFFSKVAIDLESSIPSSNRIPTEFMPSRLLGTFFAHAATDNEVATLLSKLPGKRSHLHNVPLFIYKRCSDIISPIIANLFNESVASGEFPTCLKKGSGSFIQEGQ